MTSGRKTKAVVVTDSGHILLAALSPETIAGRLHATLELKPEELGKTETSILSHNQLPR